MLYELLVQQYEMAKIEEARSMPTIQVLDPAVPPEIRKPRGTLTKAALAAIMAFVCVVFLAFIREYYVECGRCEQTDASLNRNGRGAGRDVTDKADDRSLSPLPKGE